MNNLVLNTDFRLTDAAERQLLRQMVAEQQTRFYPVTGVVNFVVDKIRGLAELAAETRTVMDEVGQRYPRLNHYL
ncbi:MAG: hypothetical protein AB7E55_19520 [Pigmentiphaga sp.]